MPSRFRAAKGLGWDRGVQAQHFRRGGGRQLIHALDAGQEGRHQVVASGIVGLERAGRLAERHLDQRRLRRVRHVVGEPAVVARTRAVEAIRVRQADHDLVDERHAET